jgi:hypothetical protein
MSKKADAYTGDTNATFFGPTSRLFTFFNRRLISPEDLWRYKDDEDSDSDSDESVWCLHVRDPDEPCRKCQREEHEEDQDGFEDCECGYTHHYEDKCPNEATAEHYEKWRK